jgi:hypothetical protein
MKLRSCELEHVEAVYNKSIRLLNIKLLFEDATAEQIEDLMAKISNHAMHTMQGRKTPAELVDDFLKEL